MKRIGIIVSAAVLCFMASGCFKEVETTTGGGTSDGDRTGGGSQAADISSSLLARYTFDNEDGTDISGNDRTGIVYADQGGTFGEGVQGRAVYLKGLKKDNFRIPYNLFRGRENWTVSFWAKDITAGVIFAGQNDNNYGDVPMLEALQSGMLAFTAYTYTNSTNITYDYVSASGWHHYVLTMSNAGSNNRNLKFYVDGVLTDNLSPNYSLDQVKDCTRVVFGGDKNGQYDVAATFWLDEVRFYGRTLSAQEVMALCNAEK